MSELIAIQATQTMFRRLLLATVSGSALIVAGLCVARADDTDKPTIWIELGGQMEATQGASAPFTAPFMFINPASGVYHGNELIQDQHATRTSYGLEGKVTLRPEGSDWSFSAGIRYGRAHNKRHTHNQTGGVSVHYTGEFHFPGTIYTPGGGYYYGTRVVPLTGTKSFRDVALKDTKTRQESRHAILDFSAGRDIGVGLFGGNGESELGLGVRLTDFTASSNVTIIARPNVTAQFVTIPPAKYHLPKEEFYQYTVNGQAQRSFKGIGPSMSWNASAALLGNAEGGELTVDWGVNVAALFGRQKAIVSHETQTYHMYFAGTQSQYVPTTKHKNSVRSRSVVLPNLGGFAGLSVKYPNAKVSLGYRADFFFGAMDTGIDVRHTQDVGFAGPFATVSIGLGG